MPAVDGVQGAVFLSGANTGEVGANVHSACAKLLPLKTNTIWIEIMSFAEYVACIGILYLTQNAFSRTTTQRSRANLLVHINPTTEVCFFY